MRYPFGKTKEAQLDDEPCSPNTPVMTSSISSPSPPSPEAGSRKSFDWRLMLGLYFSILLPPVAYTISQTGEFLIASLFDALPLLSYIDISYFLPSIVLLPFFASITDIYGRYFGVHFSLLVFLIGNVLCTGAMSMPMMLLGRVIAGIGAAGLITLTRTIMSDTPSLDKINAQQTMLFSLYVTGFNCGPVVGGFLVPYTFRWVFAVILPFIAIGMILCFVFLRNRWRSDEQEFQSATHASCYSRRKALATVRSWISKLALVDWIGAFLFVGGSTLFLLALIWGPEDNWRSARVIVNSVLGSLLMVLCVVWGVFLERFRSPSLSTNGSEACFVRPILPIEIFTSFDMFVVHYVSFISGMVFFAMFYFMAIFPALGSGLPPTNAGLQMLYFAPGTGVGVTISMQLIKYFRQPVYPIVLGNVITTIGVGLLQSATQNAKLFQVIGFSELVGVGVGLICAPLSIHLRFTKPGHVAITNAMLSFFQAVGGAVGLAQWFSVLNSKVNAYISSQLQMAAGSLSPSDAAVLEALLDKGLASVISLGELPRAVQNVVKSAFLDGMKWSFISLLPWLGLAIVLSAFLSRIEASDAQTEGEGEMQREGERVEVEIVPIVELPADKDV